MKAQFTPLARRRLALSGLLAPPTLFLVIFFLAPLAVMMVYSWLTPGMYGRIDWSFNHLNYGRIFGWADTKYARFDPVYLSIFLRSVSLAALTVLTTLVICYPAAFWVSRLPDRRKTFVLFLVTLPFFSSLIVRLFAWVLILRDTGFLNQALLWAGVLSKPLEIIYTPAAVVIGMAYVFVPFMFLPLYASVEKLDPSLLEASADLGAGRVQTFRRVVWPATLPGVVGGSLLVFIPALGNFIVPEILGGAKVVMIGNLIEQQFLSARNWPFGAALAMVVMAAVLLILIAYVRLTTREERQAAAPALPAGA